MTQRSVDKLGFLKRLLLVAIGTGAVTAPIITGLIQAPVATAQATQANRESASSNIADPQQIYHIGGDVSAPKLVYAPDPEFTEKARHAKYQGVCVIAVIIDAQGNPERVQVVRHLGMGLDKKAVEAVKQYKFKPGTRFGKPVAVEANIEVNFRLY